MNSLSLYYLSDTSKASENLTFILNRVVYILSSNGAVAIFWLGAMKIKDSVGRIALDLFHNFDLPEEVVVGRSRYKQFYFVPSNIYERENRRRPRRAREPSLLPFKDLSRVF